MHSDYSRVWVECLSPCLQHLKYHTQIHVKSRHGKNKGRKISGVEPLPGEDKVGTIKYLL